VEKTWVKVLRFGPLRNLRGWPAQLRREQGLNQGRWEGEVDDELAHRDEAECQDADLQYQYSIESQCIAPKSLSYIAISESVTVGHHVRLSASQRKRADHMMTFIFADTPVDRHFLDRAKAHGDSNVYYLLLVCW